MTRRAAAYIRRSSVSIDSPGDASRDAQLAAVQSMCGTDVTVYADWGISGTKDDRPDYQRLRAAIQAGEVASVCAYSLSRLGRKAKELLDFVELCKAQGVTIRTKVENIDTSTAMGVAMLTVIAAFAQLEAELAAERQAAALDARRARGDRLGQPPYGFRHEKQDGRIVRVSDPERPIGPLIQAYRDAGSVLGACRLLEARGIPAPKGGETWATSALTRILDENAPALLPARNGRGLRSPATAVFAHLLECPFCGRTLTPNTHRGQYYCANGPRNRETHPRYTVREVDLAPWIKAEAERFDPEPLRIEADDLTGKREAILARLDRAEDLYLDGTDPVRDRAKLDAARARAARDLKDLDAREQAVDMPAAIDWHRTPEVVNRALRTIIRRIRLDATLRPVEAEWMVPEWRA